MGVHVGVVTHQGAKRGVKKAIVHLAQRGQVRDERSVCVHGQVGVFVVTSNGTAHVLDLVRNFGISGEDKLHDFGVNIN